jgi:hypothetical protein
MIGEPRRNSLATRRLLPLTFLALVLTSSVTLIPVLVGAVSPPMIPGVAVGGMSDAMAQMVKGANVGYVRSDVAFDTRFQTLYALAKTYDFALIGILDYQTLNYESGFGLTDWKTVVTEAQKTYPAINVWEIWNEPTVAQYRLGYMDGTPGHYNDMLKAAYQILKSENSAYQILGLGGAQLGVSQDYPFAKSVFELGGGSYMDAISIHAYPYDLNTGQTWGYYSNLWTSELAEYKQFGKPIWITETGLQSGQSAESDQSQYLSESWSFFASQSASVYVWYELRDYQNSSGATVSFGLLYDDNSPKPSYTTYLGLQAFRPHRRS